MITLSLSPGAAREPQESRQRDRSRSGKAKGKTKMCAVCIPDGSAGRAVCIRHSAFGSQPLSIHTLANFASVSPLESALTKTSRKSIKRRDFKSFRIRSYTTPLHKPLIKKHLHIRG